MRRIIQQRRRIFIGCEGQSEQSYVKLLQGYATLPVHLDSVLLQPGGGDAGSLLERAKYHHNRNQKLSGPYQAAFLLLDKDKLGNSSTIELEKRAHGAGIKLIWQDPCHEAFLLRHFPGCQNKRPADSAASMEALLRLYASYVKGTSARHLQSLITLDMIRQAAAVTASFEALLNLTCRP